MSVGSKRRLETSEKTVVWNVPLTVPERVGLLLLMSDALVNREHADRYYAVRRGPGRGVYTTWPDAMNAGWYMQQGRGHTARLTSLANIPPKSSTYLSY